MNAASNLSFHAKKVIMRVKLNRNLLSRHFIRWSIFRKYWELNCFNTNFRTHWDLACNSKSFDLHWWWWWWGGGDDGSAAAAADDDEDDDDDDDIEYFMQRLIK